MATAHPTTLLQTLTRFDRSKLSPWVAARNAVGVAIALLGGLAFHNMAGGIIAATGALDAAFSDGDDPYAHRARRMLTATAFVALAVFAGRLCGGNHALAVTLAAVCAFIVGMLMATSQTAADIGTITLVTLIVFASQPANVGKAFTSGILVLAGGSIQTLLSVLFWPVRRFAPEARALGTLYAGLADTAHSGVSSSESPPGTDAVIAARTALTGLTESRSLESERYLALFTQAERIRLALLTVSRLRARLRREAGGSEDAEQLGLAMELAGKLLASISAALTAGTASEPQPECLAYLSRLSDRLRQPGSQPSLDAMRADARWQIDALAGQLRVATELAARTTTSGLEEFRRLESAKPWKLRLAGTAAVLRANLNPNSAVFRHAIRLAACVALADFLGRMAHALRAYWAPMTAAIVLKPDFTSTLSRGLLRLAGTFAGLAVTTALFALLTPAIGVQILLTVVFMFVLRWAGQTNYGMLVLPLTGLVVLMFALTGIPPAEVVAARAMNTAIGGLVVLAVNRLWPTWERTQISEVMAAMLDAYRDYFQAVRDGYLKPELERERPYLERLDRVRQAGRLARTNLEASVGRYRIEPGATHEGIAALQGILANSHRLIHAVMALEAGLSRSLEVAPRAEFSVFANQADVTLYFLAAYLRGAQMRPGDLPDLRETHGSLIGKGDRAIGRYALVNIETDRVTNSLNTLSLEVVQWVGLTVA